MPHRGGRVPAGVVPEVQRHDVLAGSHLPVPVRCGGREGVSLRRFDLDDARAESGQPRRGQRAGEVHRQTDHRGARERVHAYAFAAGGTVRLP